MELLAFNKVGFSASKTKKNCFLGNSGGFVGFPGNTSKIVGILCNKDGAEYVLGHNCVWFHIQIIVTRYR